MRERLWDWTKRYLPLEIAATACALAGGYAAAAWSPNAAVIAYAATWAENVGFYATAIGRARRQHGTFLPALKAVAMEFGPAEVLDSFVIRPACMVLFPTLLGHLGIGLIAGKIAADVVFYGLAGVMYERIKARDR